MFFANPKMPKLRKFFLILKRSRFSRIALTKKKYVRFVIFRGIKGTDRLPFLMISMNYHADHTPFGFPYQTIATGTCPGCDKRFPILENIMVEIRCAACQARFRSEKINEAK